ncbi:MAG: lysophospholipid acyltransferase family protein [Bacteroidia bacterium]
MRHIIGMPFRAVWKIFFVLNFVISLIVLYPVFFILLSRENWYPAAFRIMRFWARWVVHIPGIAVRVKDENRNASIPQPCVFVANHTSYLDIVISYIAIRNYFVYMGKAEIDKAPFLRIFFRDHLNGSKAMNIYVNRKSRSGSYTAFQRADEKLRKGISLFLYPEGTIESNGRLKPFKNGAFRLAISNQVPVVPVTFLNNWTLLQNGGFLKSFGRPGIAEVIVHEPVPTKGLDEKDLISLRHQVREIIANDLKHYES